MNRRKYLIGYVINVHLGHFSYTNAKEPYNRQRVKFARVMSLWMIIITIDSVFCVIKTALLELLPLLLPPNAMPPTTQNVHVLPDTMTRMRMWTLDLPSFLMERIVTVRDGRPVNLAMEYPC